MSQSNWGWGEEKEEEIRRTMGKAEAREATKIKLLVVGVLVTAVILGIIYAWTGYGL
jgi:hypothetical protein